MKQTTSAVPTTTSQSTTAVPNALAATTAIPAPAATVAPALAATPAPAAPEMPMQLVYRTPLQRNSQGAAVVQLQQRLRELGYFIYPENTGFFGTVTAQAVSQFQRARSLAITGIADQTLIAALNACTNACAVLPQE
ncbi:MAG: peptidoglycan-binding protein [Chloroflexi bacterium SZAS-1]|nr:peptidoglycan-binding protein [Chloroflexi bacterium SZAS-1]